MSYVSQISGNEIVDNELRHALDKKVDEIRKQVEFLSVVSKAIGEMLICICSVIQSSDSFDEAKTIEKIFNKTTGVSASDGSYSKAYGNFASIILQLCGNTLPDNYRKGIPDGGTVPLTQTLIDNAKTVCQKDNTRSFYYGSDYAADDGSISTLVESKGMYNNIGRISSMDSTAKKKTDSNIF